jgi:hypothetical protein
MVDMEGESARFGTRFGKGSSAEDLTAHSSRPSLSDIARVTSVTREPPYVRVWRYSWNLANDASPTSSQPQVEP